MNRIIVALLLLSLIPGYAAGQKYQRPAVQTPSTYRGDTATQPDPQSLANLKWFEVFKDEKLQELIKENVTFEIFFQHASLNPNAHLITGVICGYRVEEIENPLTQQVRYLDKLVDELAKGRKMEKILRGS